MSAQMGLFADQAARDADQAAREFAAGYAHAAGGGAEPPRQLGRVYWLGWQQYHSEPSGPQRKAHGMAQALAHANAASRDWSEQAYAAVAHFAAQRIDFRAEQVRADAEQHGLPAAPHNRAWGAVISKAARAGLIRRVRFAPCDNPKAHSCHVSVWIGQ